MLQKIISGGQTGADRGALDAALAAGFACGGWCPAGRRAEDGPIPASYPLTEMPSPRYIARTRRNVEDSDGTLIIGRGTLTGGTRATERHAIRLGRPCLVVDPDRWDLAATAAAVTEWIAAYDIRTLNVAGPRASSDPAIHAATAALVAAVISAVSCRS